MSDHIMRPFQGLTVYMPATAERPVEPAPWVLTEEEAARLLRLDNKDVYSTLRRYRLKRWLKAVQVGNHVRYRLPDVLAFLETAQEENPR